ncbi:imidazole glycerol phosphate synthase subunit HisH [Cohaesibacter celericrescens]|uniref:Imidazole glycerol phosphate synthase subunit HisH n=1 Tax=Cohaesibacter celericrescens TaxID=2067669 RepID=A0A2N5XNY6_9HYPH|nr:imidazole glycerol phosphate synthase subunit HisH [Cohaesibacter celericrescens]PLW76239.1 imidazole glycerol phosphate synthase subunit HisH [Cohaesibacter celericrescens]
MRIAIIDYGSGNLCSAAKAFERAARESELDAEVLVTCHPDDVRKAGHIVLPGVGAFADCRAGLDAVDGMTDALTEAVIKEGKPFLGICVGLQLLASRGLEHGVTQGLDWISGDVVAMQPSDPSLKIPHMGWNTVNQVGEHPLWAGIPTGPDGLHAYFVHSYHLEPTDPAHILATCDYAQTVTAMVGRDNIVGTQFHPEKSQKLGLALISNFLNWRP